MAVYVQPGCLSPNVSVITDVFGFAIGAVIIINSERQWSLIMLVEPRLLLWRRMITVLIKDYVNYPIHYHGR